MATVNKLIVSNRQRLFNLIYSFANKSNSNVLNHNHHPSIFVSRNFPIRNVSTTKFLFDETPIKMPALSPTMSTGIIVKWHKKEGDKISAGDILCEVQTDKAVVAYEFDDDGILAKILVQENSAEINVGDLIAIVCGEDDDWKNVKVPENLKTSIESSSSTTDSSPPKSETKPAETTTIKETPKIDWSQIKISPSARNLIDQYGIVLSDITPSGPHGILTKEDVFRVVQEKNLKPKDLSVSKTTEGVKKAEVSDKPSAKTAKAPPPSAAPFVDLEITNMRKTIAKRLTESKSNTPHAYMSIKCFMDDVLKLRKHFKARSIPVSINDMIVKATAVALKQVPYMNCQWNKETESIEIIGAVDVSIAVATPTGLITPIIRNANCLTLEEISATSKELIQKAKDNKLLPQEFIGGTFSISNLGMYDIDHFVGVINPPQAAILAVGSTRQKFFGDPDNYQLRNQAIMSLSYDARAIDEEIAAEFMEKLQQNLENADILLHSDGGSSRRRLSSLI